jgi:hypothetical protein
MEIVPVSVDELNRSGEEPDGGDILADRAELLSKEEFEKSFS